MSRDQLVAELATAAQVAADRHPYTIRLATAEGPTPLGVLLAEAMLDVVLVKVEPLF